MRRALVSLACVLGLVLSSTLPARGASKEIIQLQRDVTLLQQQVRELQQSLDSNNAVLKTLVEQTLDAVNRMKTTVSTMEQAVQEAQAATNTRVDSMGTQVQSLRDAVDELRARLGQISQQVAETRSVLESVDARLAPLGSGEVAQTPEGEGAPLPVTSTRQAPPSADVLYSTALRDFIGGKYDLARQEFSDYLKHYARTQLAGNAQFYIGETYYQQGEHRKAIAEYDKVLNDFPNSYKIAAAHLKKSYSLLELGEREDGVRLLRALIEKFPNSEEAQLARRRLERLGEIASR